MELVPSSDARHSVARVGWFYLRALGIVFVLAFASLLPQLSALLGPQGLSPAVELLDYVRQVLPGPERYLRLPTLLWALGAGEGALRGVGFAGLACGVLLAANVAPRFALVGAWACYLSLTNVSGVFLGYQWDALLLEAALVSLPLTPGHLLPPGVSPAPPRGAILLPRLLLFRLMVMSGLVKLASGDPTWRDFTALQYHYGSQPLPNPIAWFAHLLPPILQRTSVGVMFVIELVFPFLLFGPRRARLAAAFMIALLQFGILATGNYGFFNLLTLVLCLSALDDGVLARWRIGGPPPVAPVLPRRRPRLGAVALVLFGGAYAVLGFSQDFQRLSRRPLPGVLEKVEEVIAGFRSINTYGLFAVMTTERREIVLEGSADGQTWKEYLLPYRPGRVDEAPHFVAPHQPRLDWQMWFAALSSCEDNPWLLRLQEELLRGEPTVRRLFTEDPFPDAPPRFVRTRLFDYRFTDWDTWRATGHWWTRTELGPYCPPLTLENGQLRAVP
ncbi:lipase maturation factor family protein [Vitiosangium sp. GDMCC 1.1324]|uniref:lipase maturation factor family protein n=1 Tax=Vitiosangium sp. (strain GDMCC 1.1324) TaxID=2138576 RepID=UPI000D353A58|nr:lipase maturation factor family protein [Vitiosangium sp. GDMCC 1.1324]PTL78667.1 membrane protein [Vitiosangium sp. GDMCC 1.1324]